MGSDLKHPSSASKHGSMRIPDSHAPRKIVLQTHAGVFQGTLFGVGLKGNPKVVLLFVSIPDVPLFTSESFFVSPETPADCFGLRGSEETNEEKKEEKKDEKKDEKEEKK